MRVSFEEAVHRFLVAREADGYRPNTIKSNRSDLRRAIRAVGSDLDMRKMSRQHVDHILHFSAKAGCRTSSINQQHATLSAFFKWCRSVGVMRPDQNPLEGKKYRRIQKRPRRRVDLGDFPRLLDAAEASHPRDRILIALGIYLFLRKSEIVNLKVADVDLNLNIMSVTIQKTYDHDEMVIVPELREELRKWMTYYTEQCGNLQPHWYLVPSKHTGGLTRDPDNPDRRIRLPERIYPERPVTRPYDVVKRALRRMGWETDGEWEGVHTLRRSAALAAYREAVDAGVDGALMEIKTWLHHKSVTTSELYLGIESDRERRNKNYSNRPLYPSLADSKVTTLRIANEDTGTGV